MRLASQDHKWPTIIQNGETVLDIVTTNGHHHPEDDLNTLAKDYGAMRRKELMQNALPHPQDYRNQPTESLDDHMEARFNPHDNSRKTSSMRSLLMSLEINKDLWLE